jgi:3-hydroxybutyryl-CoA dehydratase
LQHHQKQSLLKKDIINEASAQPMVEFSIMVREEDINQFASLSGDFSPNHMDEEFMKKSQFGKRIAHGALLVAFMSRASTMIIGQLDDGKDEKTPVSLGYDRIRFIHPVFYR